MTRHARASASLPARAAANPVAAGSSLPVSAVVGWASLTGSAPAESRRPGATP
jgi:hypothetical protein